MKAACAALLIVGIALLAASFLWPRLDDGRSDWPDEKAAAYQEVSARLHGLSFRDLSKEENRRLYEEAEGEYNVLDAQLKRARERGGRVAGVLKWTGFVLAIVGGLGLLAQRDPD